jgi:hypothetical protein
MKKLLFTIIILGACLVGSSQNWDSVRVGNVDVDSIMLGGVKIWEKPNVDTITWTYEGVMTVGGSAPPVVEQYGYRSAGDLGYGYMVPNVENENSTLILCWGLDYDNNYSLGLLWGNSNSVNLLTTDNVLLEIGGVTYELTYTDYGKEKWYIFNLLTNPFPAVGETCEIKLRYTLAP